MTTAQNVITESLEIAGVLPIGQTPSSLHNSRGLTYLNDMIASWKSEWLDLQLDTLAATDTIYLDASDIICLKQNLSVLLAAKYKLPISQHTQYYAATLFDSLVEKYLQAGLEEMELPSGLVSATRSNIEAG